MKSREKKANQYWKKLKFRYRLSAINENTLEEVWRIKTSIFTGLVALFLLSLALITITSVFIIATPIRYYLPGYLDVEIRERAVKTAIKIDSLEQALLLNTQYIENLKLVMDGALPAHYVAQLDSSNMIKENDPRLAKTELEREFVAKFEDEEKYTLSVFQANSATNNTGTFNKPIRGVVSEKYDKEAGENHGIVYTIASTEPVLATADGTIVYIGYDIDNDKIVHLQHKNGYLSIYKGLTNLVKKTGDTVKASEAIGSIIVVDDKNEEVKPSTLRYELWNKGMSLDPETYTLF